MCHPIATERIVGTAAVTVVFHSVIQNVVLFAEGVYVTQGTEVLAFIPWGDAGVVTPWVTDANVGWARRIIVHEYKDSRTVIPLRVVPSAREPVLFHLRATFSAGIRGILGSHGVWKDVPAGAPPVD